MSDKLEVLRRVPLFADLDDRSLQAIAVLAREERHAAGAILMLAGEPGDAFYILVDGTVRIERDGRTVRSIGTGGFLGEIALVERRPRSATATAVTDVTALVLHQHEFDRLLESMPAVHRRVLAAIERRERGEKPETA